ncbi:MAG: DUF4838 domain-containing protein [Thermoplasmata archaeon]|nr:MAG: DUF4838 domain-containing protein [Thermoplasmata archaeon]
MKYVSLEPSEWAELLKDMESFIISLKYWLVKRKYYHLSLLIIFSLFMNFHPSSNDLILAENGVAYYAIYYGENESIIIRHAAEELAHYLEEITSADFEITNDPNIDKKLIIIGRNNTLTEAIEDKMEFSSIIADGFKIMAHDGNIYISGKIDRGTLYGVYYFLDVYLGVKWLSPDFEVVPKKNTLKVDAMNDLQNPRFLYREIFSMDTDDAYFRQHNRLNGCRGETHREYIEYPPEINTWSRYAPQGEHNFQDVVSAEYYYGGQILTMEEAVREEAAQYFINKIASHGTEPWYSFSQEDCGWIPDDVSKAFAKEHCGKLSAPVVDLVINVTERVRKVYPDAHLSTLAYQWSFEPPCDMAVPPYVMIELAPIDANFGYSYNDTHNSMIYSAFNGWSEMASSLAIWDYITNFQNYLQPWPNIYAMCQNIKYLSSIEPMKVYFGEGAYNTEGAEFAELRAWIASRLLWDPNQNYKELIDEFCDYYYGQASPYIKEYIELLHHAFLQSNEKLRVKQPITSNYLSLDFIKRADELMAKADGVAEGIYKKHVHEVRIGVDMTILLREHLYKAEAEERGETWHHDEKRKERFREYVKEANISYYCEDLPISYLLEAIDVDRIKASKPDIVSSQDEWIDFQDLDMQYCCGAHIVEDMEASDHGALEYDGKEWAIVLPLDLLPEGNWSLYAYVRADIKENAMPDDIAFNMGIYPGLEREIKVRKIKQGYNVFEFPSILNNSTIAWFSCGNGSRSIYVDRIVAIKNDVRIVKPKNGIYVMDRYILPFNFPIIIGKITVEAEISGNAKKVEFYVDNELKYEDESPPYQWQWNEHAIGWHEIKVAASNGEDSVQVFKIY